MSRSSELLTPETWDQMRRQALSLKQIPSWGVNLLSLSFGEARSLPRSLSEKRLSRPILRRYARDEKIRVLERSRYSTCDEMRQAKLDALKRHSGGRILELETATLHGLCRFLYSEETHELLNVEILPKQFVVLPRWQELLSVWRWVGVIALVIGGVAWIVSPTFYTAAIITLVAIALYLLVLWAFGAGHVVEGAILALILVIISGLVWGAYQRAIQRTDAIQQMNQESQQQKR